MPTSTVIAAERRRRPASLGSALLVVLIALGLAVGIAPPHAGAQDAPGAAPEINSWALAPTGSNPDEPSSRSFLSYGVAAGATLDDSVTLWNYGNVPLTFRVYATDAFNNDAGDFDLLAGDKTPSDLGAWVRLAQEYVTVPANARIDIPFTLRVPANARPGDHAAAILASSQVEGVATDGRAVTLDRRTGSRLYLKVDGPETPALTVEGIHSVYHPSINPFGGRLDVTYTVRNTGNLRLGGTQSIVVRNPFGTEMASRTPDALPELLPGNATTVRETFTGVTAAFRVTTEIEVRPTLAPLGVTPGPSGSTPSVADATSVAMVKRSGTTWAFPFSVLLLVVVGGTTVRWIRRRRLQPGAAGRRGGLGGPPSVPSGGHSAGSDGRRPARVG